MQWLFLILLIPYLYLLFNIYASLRRVVPFTRINKTGIRLSVVIACRDEEENIPSLLADLSVQELDHDLFEVIVVDDDSIDNTRNIALKYHGIKNLKVLKNQGLGKKKAIRTGVEASTGELIVTTDADCRVGSRWLETIASYYSINEPDMIIGPVVLKGLNGFLQGFQDLEFLALQGVTAGTAVSGDPTMCNGANLAFRKDTYLRHSSRLHEEKLSGDDLFLLHSLKENRENKIEWLESSGATVETHAAPDWKSFLSQRTRWISKAGAYTDRTTIILAAVTFVAIMLQPLLIIAGIFDIVYLEVFMTLLVLKSIPEILILKQRMSASGKRGLMKWFLPSQIFYPWYVMAVISGLGGQEKKWKKK